MASEKCSQIERRLFDLGILSSLHVSGREKSAVKQLGDFCDGLIKTKINVGKLKKLCDEGTATRNDIKNLKASCNTLIVAKTNIERLAKFCEMEKTVVADFRRGKLNKLLLTRAITGIDYNKLRRLYEGGFVSGESIGLIASLYDRGGAKPIQGKLETMFRDAKCSTNFDNHQITSLYNAGIVTKLNSKEMYAFCELLENPTIEGLKRFCDIGILEKLRDEELEELCIGIKMTLDAEELKELCKLVIAEKISFAHVTKLNLANVIENVDSASLKKACDEYEKEAEKSSDSKPLQSI